LSAQLKALRNSVQPEIPKAPAPPPNDSAASASVTDSIRVKDHQIDSLRVELAELEVRHAEESNSALLRARKAEEALIQAKLDNMRLAENVESYQILLQDRTLKGEYSIAGFQGVPDGSESESLRSSSPFDGVVESNPTSLAAELEAADDPTI